MLPRPPDAPSPSAPPLSAPGPAFLTADALAAALPACRDPAGWAGPLRAACGRWGIATPRRVAAFLGQVGHESGDLNRLQESLNYTPAALRQLWPVRVPAWLADRIGRTAAHPADQAAIAEAVYGGRMGNARSGDGWRFRGCGLIQLTGRDNHGACAAAFGLEAEAVPDWLLTRDGAAQAAAWWWHSRGLDALADGGDVDAISRRVNGGDNGLADRRDRTARALAALEARAAASLAVPA